mmetsp:Transcript_5030/g.6506  ORF Transcript_5030/g.6506 Transcript_5030/m.6506 type:complete len:472 (+) Transcript_5030:97-1512(+)
MRQFTKILVQLFVIASFHSFTIYAIDSPAPKATTQTGSNHSQKGFSTFANNIGDSIDDILNDVHNVLEHKMAFAGKIFPVLSKLYISPVKAKEIYQEVKHVAELGEWITIVLIGWATMPMIKMPYQLLGIGKSRRNTEKELGQGVEKRKKPFEESFVFQLAQHISSAGKIAALVYGIDCVIIALKTLGFEIEKKYSQFAAKLIYSTWFFTRALNWKRYVVNQIFIVANRGNEQGSKNRAIIANKISDIILFAACGFLLIDILNLQPGVALKSFFAVGGAGTVLISFASKDVAMAMASGLALQASDKMFEGDLIKCGDIIGNVDHIGVTETIITDSDEMVMAIPNKELAHSRIINIGKLKFSRVKKDIHFHYEDCQKLPVLLEEIKSEICASCPLAVIDGSKPLRAYLKNFGDSFLEVEVDVRLSVRPGGELYKKGTQDVLLAIDRAVRRHKVEFAVVTEVFHTNVMNQQLK